MKTGLLLFAIITLTTAIHYDAVIDQALAQWPIDAQLPLEIPPGAYFPYTYIARGFRVEFTTTNWNLTCFNAKRTSSVNVTGDLVTTNITLATSYLANGTFNWAGGRDPMTVYAHIPMLFELRAHTTPDMPVLMPIGTGVLPGTTASVIASKQFARSLYNNYLVHNAAAVGRPLADNVATDLAWKLKLHWQF